MPAVPGLTPDSSIAEAQRLMADAFNLARLDNAETDARLLLGHALQLDRSKLFSQANRLLTADEVARVSALAARRLKHEPVSRIIGRKEFWSLMLDVSPAVLDPRPDTETIVEAALAYIDTQGARDKPLRLLDIGTGSGALMLALLSELKSATGIATDISPDALAVARGNAGRLNLASRCDFILCNIADGVSGPFDLVVSNPPYIEHSVIATLDPEVRDYDPALALDGGHDGLDFYRAIAAEARRLLAPRGLLVVELGAGQEPAVRDLFTMAGLHVGDARADLGGIPRALSASSLPELAITTKKPLGKASGND
ncbi:MAG: peptide chain release factor N(5)-glutamine methyltransferase [Pseudolabrys sp.]|nr:peptide chain release factor N(5)-glutamine methyltransferase [Pseudolabrys sp.]